MTLLHSGNVIVLPLPPFCRNCLSRLLIWSPTWRASPQRERSYPWMSSMPASSLQPPRTFSTPWPLLKDSHNCETICVCVHLVLLCVTLWGVEVYFVVCKCVLFIVCLQVYIYIRCGLHGLMWCLIVFRYSCSHGFIASYPGSPPCTIISFRV